MSRTTRRLLAAALLALLGARAQATVISYDVANVGGNTWTYTYTVTNDTLSSDIEELTIWFDAALFGPLTSAAAPTGWDPLAIDADPGIPADGFYDALALAGALAPGATLGGFAVSFAYLGAGAPGAQLFEIVDPASFAVLDSGFTRAVPAVVGVAEPGSAAALALGLLLLALRRRTIRPRQAEILR